MLEVGNMASHEEDRTHFSAWAITSSPLILGFDVTDDAKVTKVWDIISNQEVLAVSQTWAGHPGRLVKNVDPSGGASQTMQIWAKKLGENEQAVLVLSNSDSTAYSVEIALTDIGFGATDSVAVRDIYQQKDLDTVQGSFKTDSITTHDSRMYIFKKQ